MKPFEDLISEMTAFFQVRDWDQFHSPKNVAISLVVEASELLEHFRWITEEESYQLSAETLDQVKDEIGDVLISLIHLSNKLKIDPLQAAHQKMQKNGQRYPVSASKGKNHKYTAYQKDQSTS